MNDSCGCIYIDADETYTTLDKRYSQARTYHWCTECGRTIIPGETYEYYKGVLRGDKPQVFKTCEDCLSVRDEFFCQSYCFEMIWQDARDHVDDLAGEISSECLLRLKPGAREKVLDIIDDVFQTMNEDDDAKYVPPE